jgi:hypothetical protein
VSPTGRYAALRHVGSMSCRVPISKNDTVQPHSSKYLKPEGIIRSKLPRIATCTCAGIHRRDSSATAIMRESGHVLSISPAVQFYTPWFTRHSREGSVIQIGVCSG